MPKSQAVQCGGMMGQCPHLHIEVKPTVNLCIAVVLSYTERASKGINLISKLACELLTMGVQGSLNLI